MMGAAAPRRRWNNFFFSILTLLSEISKNNLLSFGHIKIFKIKKVIDVVKYICYFNVTHVYSLVKVIDVVKYDLNQFLHVKPILLRVILARQSV